MPGFNPEALIQMMGIVVDLYFMMRRLEIMQKTVDLQEQIADRAMTTAEDLYAAHEDVRARDGDYYAYANSMPTYTQHYDCAMARANATLIRKIGTQGYLRMKSTDAYSMGERRGIAEETMGLVALHSGSVMGIAFNQEDRFRDMTEIHRVRSIANSVDGTIFSGAGALSGMSSIYAEAAGRFGNQAEQFLGSAVSGAVGLLYGQGDTRSLRRVAASPFAKSDRFNTGSGVGNNLGASAHSRTGFGSTFAGGGAGATTLTGPPSRGFLGFEQVVGPQSATPATTETTLNSSGV